jgi:hypothetical protein
MEYPEHSALALHGAPAECFWVLHPSVRYSVVVIQVLHVRVSGYSTVALKHSLAVLLPAHPKFPINPCIQLH